MGLGGDVFIITVATNRKSYKLLSTETWFNCSTDVGGCVIGVISSHLPVRQSTDVTSAVWVFDKDWWADPTGSLQYHTLPLSRCQSKYSGVCGEMEALPQTGQQSLRLEALKLPKAKVNIQHWSLICTKIISLCSVCPTTEIHVRDEVQVLRQHKWLHLKKLASTLVVIILFSFTYWSSFHLLGSYYCDWMYVSVSWRLISESEMIIPYLFYWK